MLRETNRRSREERLWIVGRVTYALESILYLRTISALFRLVFCQSPIDTEIFPVSIYNCVPRNKTCVSIITITKSSINWRKLVYYMDVGNCCDALELETIARILLPGPRQQR